MIDKLYKLAITGRKQSEDELFRYLTERFRFFVRRRVGNDKDAEDIVQITMIAISEKYRSIKFETSFASWAYKILEFKMIDYLRSRGRHKAKVSNISDQIHEGVAQELDRSVVLQMLDCIGKVGQANRRFARILNLHYQGYTSAEICEKLLIKKANFYVVLSRARTMLALCLKKGDIENND